MNTSSAVMITLGSGAALFVAAMNVPMPVAEWLVGSLGISEWLEKGAPPLGDSFRLLFAGACALTGMAAVMSALPAETRFDMKAMATGNGQKGTEIMAALLTKLANFARGRGSGLVDAVPGLRRQDQHPDAPPRPPLFVSRDLAGAMGPGLAAAGGWQETQTETPQPAWQPATAAPVAYAPPAAPVAAPPPTAFAPIATAPVAAMDAAEPSLGHKSWLAPETMPTAPSPMPIEMIRAELQRMAAPVTAQAETAAPVQLAQSHFPTMVNAPEPTPIFGTPDVPVQPQPLPSSAPMAGPTFATPSQIAPVPVSPAVSLTPPVAPRPLARPALDGLTIDQLTQRLASSMRGEADAEVAGTSAPEAQADSPDENAADESLDAALAALRNLTTRAAGRG